MADYRITCTVKSPPETPHYHEHIIRVGLGDDTVWHKMLTVHQVYGLMNAGDRFYTKSKSTGAIAEVHPYQCPKCNVHSLRSSPDAVRDNNLDNLPKCEGG